MKKYSKYQFYLLPTLRLNLIAGIFACNVTSFNTNFDEVFDFSFR